MLLTVIEVAAALLGYYLLLKRRIIGLAIIAILIIVGLAGLMIRLPEYLSYSLYVAAGTVVILGLPWLLVFLETRGREEAAIEN